jgi:SNF2 family DNA or RNA helicase
MGHPDSVTLRPYQVEGVAWAKSRYRAFIFMPAGTGKTIIAIKAALEFGLPVVVVCPAVAVGVWQFELSRAAPHIEVLVQPSRQPVAAPTANQWLITTYDRAALETPAHRVGVILDEAHSIKNPKTQRFERVTSLIAQSRGFCWAMTGTPILKDLDDLWHQMAALGVAKQLYRTRENFLKLFGGHYTVAGLQWPAKGEVPARAWEPLRPLMLRRDKQTLLGLPPKLYEDWYLELGAADRQFFDDLAAKYPAECQAWDGDGEPHLMQELARYSALKARLALPHIREQATSAGPVVVFSAHRAAALWLADELGWPSITGSTSVDERTALAAKFQAGELPGLVCTIQAAGLALTLTRASTAIYVSLTWSGAVNEQSEDRLHRSGQTCEVRIVRCRTNSALEKQVDAVLRKKQRYLVIPEST